MSKEAEWEWDKERVAVVALMVVIIIGVGYIAVASVPGNVDRNVTYTLNVTTNMDRIDTVYRTFFGNTRDINNASLLTARIQIADIPDVTRVIISIQTVLPMRMIAIVVSDYPAETNVLHGQSEIPIEQISYVLTLDIGQRNLIAYMFFENSNSGNFEFAVSSFKLG